MIKKIILFCITLSSLFPSGAQDGDWLTSWLYPETGLFYWSVITFLLVFVILRWKAWGPLMDALEHREKQIKESLNKAEQMIKDQEQSAADNEAILVRAREEAQNFISQAKDAGEKLKSKLEQDGQEKYESMLDNAKNQIDTEKQKALSDIKNMVVDIAISASEKIVKRNLNDDDNKKIIEETVELFQQKVDK